MKPNIILNAIALVVAIGFTSCGKQTGTSQAERTANALASYVAPGEKDEYYLFYSGDNCCGPDADYGVMVARSDHATGPFQTLEEAKGVPHSLILFKNDRWLAPGHNCIAIDEAGQWAKREGHVVWIGLKEPSPELLERVQAQLGDPPVTPPSETDPSTTGTTTTGTTSTNPPTTGGTTTTPSGDPSAPITLTQLDRSLVVALGLKKAANEFTQGARAAGLTVPGRFGVEVVARLLRLRTNHPAAQDFLELRPQDPAA